MLDLIYVFAGIIQGVLEWIPISSEGFLFVYFSTVGIDPVNSFLLSIAFHLPTAIAAIIYFHKDFSRLLMFKFREKTVEFLVVSSFSTALTAIPLYFIYKQTLATLELFIKEASLVVFFIVGLAMIITGLFIRHIQLDVRYKKLENGTRLDYFLVGLIQGLAIIPGVTRSGVTIAAFIWRRFEKEDVIRGSFLMAPIVSLGALLLELVVGDIKIVDITNDYIIYALVTALIISFLTIDAILRIVRNMPYWKFLIFIGVIMVLVNIFYLYFIFWV